jgi:hypothetical protein|tara:strand:+ start:5150 stop:5359 length:210 start_codon:yes stop_codon:yes gene_type:complete
MKIELNRNDLIALVKGSFVPYEAMESETLQLMGSFTGGFSDRWNWNYSVPDMITDQELWDTYNILLREK